MEKFDNIDKHLKELAENAGQQPPEFIWKNIDDALPKEEKKPRFLWFILSSLVVFVGLLGYMFTQNIDSKDSLLLATQTGEETSVIAATQAKLDDVQNSVLSTDTNDPIVERTNKERRRNEDSTVQKEIRNKNKSKLGLDTNTSNNKNLLQSLPQAPNKNAEESLTNNRIAQSQATIISNKVGAKPQSQTFVKEINQSIKELLKISPIKNQDPKELQYDHAFGKPSIDTNYQGSANRFFVEIGSIFGLHDTHLNNSSKASTLRNSTESSWYTTGVSAQLGYKLNHHLYLKTGLDYRVSRDIYDYVSSNTTILQDSTSQANYRVSKGTYFSEGDITYQQYNIPITLGGELSKGKFKFGLEAGALINLGFITEGKIFKEDYSESRVEIENSYKNNLGLGLKASLALGMQVARKGTLYFRPTYSQYLTNTNSDLNGVESKLSQYYFELNYRYSF